MYMTNSTVAVNTLYSNLHVTIPSSLRVKGWKFEADSSGYDKSISSTYSNLIQTTGDDYLVCLVEVAPIKKLLEEQGPAQYVVCRRPYQWHAETFMQEVRSCLENCKLENAEYVLTQYANDVEQYINEYKIPYSVYELTYDPFVRNERPRRYREVHKLMCLLEDIKATMSLLQSKRRHQRRYKVHSESCDNMKEMDCGMAASQHIDEKEVLMDMSGNISVGADVGHSAFCNIGQRELVKMENFLTRPVLLEDVELAVGDVASLRIDVWDLMTLDPSVRSKLRNYAYMSADLEIRINVTGSKYHYGKLLASYQPFPLRNASLQYLEAEILTNREQLLSYLSQARGTRLIDVGENQPVDVWCPFISFKPLNRLFNQSSLVLSDITPYDDFEDFGSLYLYSFGPVDSINSAAAGTVNIKIYGCFKNVRLGTTTATRIAVSSESLDEEDTGPIERLASVAEKIAGYASYVPVIQPLAKATRMVFSGIKGIAHYFGWSTPIMNTNPTYVKNNPWMNGATVMRGSTAKKITLDPKQGITVDPRATGVEEDELSIAYICRRESYLTSFTWSFTDPVSSSTIWRCLVNPMLHSRLENQQPALVQPTSMAYAATPFVYWRGDITFRFVFVVSPLHRGKIGVFYEPNITQYTLYEADFAMNKQFYKVIDLAETQELEVTIQWAAPRAWLRVPEAGSILSMYGDSFSGASSAFRFNNGMIGVVPFTALTAPEDPEIQVLVFVKSENMRFNQLTQEEMPDDRRAVSESKDSSDDNPLENVMLNKSSADMEHISLHHFGEEIYSFRSALKRFTTVRFASILATSDFGVINSQRPNIVEPRPAFGEQTSQPVTLFNYLRYAFLGVRGSMRYRYRLCLEEGSDDTDTQKAIVVSLDLPTSGAPSNTLSWLTSERARNNMIGSVTFLPHTNGGVEYEVPFYSNNLFAISCADDLIGTNNLGEMETSWTKNHIIQKEFSDANTKRIFYVHTAAAGEDFTYLRYLGAPPFRRDSIA
jgi:hypothetical protein